MLRKIVSILLVAILAISGVGSVCATGEPQYRVAPFHWQYPVGNEWDIKYERANNLVNDAYIYEVNYPSHKIVDIEKGGKKIDSSFVGKSIIVHTHWYGQPDDTNVLVPYYPGGEVWISNHFDSAAYSQSWIDLTINNWCCWMLGKFNGDSLVTYTLPPDFKLSG
jgi:hypothetical protein